MRPAARSPDVLQVAAAGLAFRNPVLLAAGTAGFGVEVEQVVDLRRVGGIVTKAVSLEPRPGAAAPRVGEFGGGMINAVGLANPGVARVAADHLPALAARAAGARVLVNVVGRTIREFAEVVAALDDAPTIDAYELNVSCPNVEAGGLEFGADPAALAELVRGVRRVTARPLFVKLSPVAPDLVAAARVALDSGATGLVLVNTIPGLVVDVVRRAPVLGRGAGGVSGPAILPVGVLATWRVHQATGAPIVGVGGVRRGTDAVQYLLAGATLVGVGTAALRDPRAPVRIAGELREWCQRQGVRAIGELVGALRWPA